MKTAAWLAHDAAEVERLQAGAPTGDKAGKRVFILVTRHKKVCRKFYKLRRAAKPSTPVSETFSGTSCLVQCFTLSGT